MTAVDKPVQRTHHLAKFIYLQLRIEKKSLAWLAETSGVSYSSIKRAMSGRSDIYLLNVEAMLNTLGYTIKPTPIKQASPAKVAA